MPRHPDFERILNNFIKEYGPEEGKNVYYAYLHNENYKEEKSLESQKKHNDAISNNIKTVQKSINDFILTEQEKYKLIIDRFVTDSYNNGLRTAAIELSMLPSEFGDLREQQKQLNILKQNSQLLLFNLMDDVKKEIGLMLTDINLNNVPFTNTKLKEEVQKLFNNKIGRLQSQIITETDRTFNTALEFGYKKSGIITHKQWVAVIDGRTSSVCQALNGEIVQIGEPFSLGFYTAPAHPNCRSRIVGLTLSEVDMLKNSDSIRNYLDLPRFNTIV